MIFQSSVRVATLVFQLTGKKTGNIQEFEMLINLNKYFTILV